MTLLQKLQSHKGGLIRLKTELYWYDGRGWDKNPGRICLILDAAAPAALLHRAAPAAAAARALAVDAGAAAAALLLIDGSPRWIWVTAADVEVIDEPA